LSKCSVVSKRGVLARGEPCGSRAGTLVRLRAIVTRQISPYRDGDDMSFPRIRGYRLVSGHLAQQTSANDQTKSPARRPAPVRNLRSSSVALTNPTRRKRLAAAPLRSIASTSSKFAEDRRQARLVFSQLELFVTASLLDGCASIGFEFACKRNPTAHLTPTLWTAGQLPAAA